MLTKMRHAAGLGALYAMSVLQTGSSPIRLGSGSAPSTNFSAAASGDKSKTASATRTEEPAVNPSASPKSSVPVTARERTLMAENFCAERLAHWQKRLNLQDWTISVLVVRATELKPKTLGNIHWDTENNKKIAVIRVLDPADYKLPWTELLQDLEFTVVHELIHLELSPVLAPLQRNDANRREEEHAVNHMSEGFLKGQRDYHGAMAKIAALENTNWTLTQQNERLSSENEKLKTIFGGKNHSSAAPCVPPGAGAGYVLVNCNPAKTLEVH